jgi:hypothetical protein
MKHLKIVLAYVLMLVLFLAMVPVVALKFVLLPFNHLVLAGLTAIENASSFVADRLLK